MHANKMIFSAALVLGFLTAGLTTSAYASSDDDKQAVEQTLTEFYASLNAMFNGEVLPMQQVWSHADDVTCMGPLGGITTGWDQVSALWQQQADLKLGGEVQPSEIHVTIGNDLAFVECYEVGNNVDADGQPIDVAIRATNLLRKENGEWKFIGHHTDLLPALQDAENEPVVTIEADETVTTDSEPAVNTDSSPNATTGSQPAVNVEGVE